MQVRIVMVLLALAAVSCKRPPAPEERPALDLSSPSPDTATPRALSDAQAAPAPQGADVRSAAADAVAAAETKASAIDGGMKTALPPSANVASLAESISWTIVPKELEVMRNTPVKLGMSWNEAPDANVTCEWDPGDRTGLLTGCNVDHVFVGGLSDRTVTLRVLVDGKEAFRESRLLAIERLPVQTNPDNDYQLPAAPAEGAGVRILMAGAFFEMTPEATANLVEALTVSKASLAILFLNGPTTGPQAQALLDGVQTLGVPLVPILCDPAGLGEGAPSAIPAPTVLVHSSKAELPFKYSFLHQGVSFTLLDSREREGSVAMEKWLLDEFEQARVASHRLVLSCSALENYTEKDMGTLQPPFRFYEKLMRGDLTLFVAGSQPVFYYARYGQLPTLAPGVAWGNSQPLPGMESPQGPLLTVVDLMPGVPPKVMPVKVTAPGTVVSMKAYPMKAGSYHRVLQPSLGTAPIKPVPAVPPASATGDQPAALPALPGLGQPVPSQPGNPVPQPRQPELPALNQPVVLPPGPAPAAKPAQPVGIYPPPVEP